MHKNQVNSNSTSMLPESTCKKVLGVNWAIRCMVRSPMGKPSQGQDRTGWLDYRLTS
ncbi:hypothetical protein O77CONTIG1_00415 [Leptolyngbya sp. O-77]|nr:hypothetical protein O77CONTIG1_00415 [Leptolyngbya sp. O-77]